MKKSAVLFVYFLYKKSAFCLKITANNFGFLDQKTKIGMNPTIELIQFKYEKKNPLILVQSAPVVDF